MYEIPIFVLLVVTLVFERWLIGTTREVIAVGRRRKGFRHGRIGRWLLLGALVAGEAGLAVAACGMILAMIRIW